MSGVWTEEMDRELLDRKDRRGLSWRAVVPINGMGMTRCQQRYRWLKSGQGKPEIKVAEPAARLVVKWDGLEWLRHKKRLTPVQLFEGYSYRDLFRDAGELSMKSQLGQLGQAGQGSGIGYEHQTAVVGVTAAKRKLFIVRHQVLRTQSDMLTVMDGVCGIGHTVRELAGGDQPRSRELEAVLRVALDLLVAFREAERAGGERPMKKSA